MGSGLKTPASSAASNPTGFKTDTAGNVTGYQAPKFNDALKSPGFHMSDFGNGWATFKDNKSKTGLSGADVVNRTLVGAQPQINQTQTTNSPVTAYQTAPVDFLGMDGSQIGRALSSSPELAALYSTVFGSGVDPRMFNVQGPKDAGARPQMQRGGGTTQPTPLVSQPPPAEPWTPHRSGFTGNSNAQMRAAIADYNNQNSFLNNNPGTGTYSSFAEKQPQRGDFGSEREYLAAELAWQKRRENRFGNVNQESWGLQPGTPEWAAYRAKMGLPG
jgi:hypothetical protein